MPDYDLGTARGRIELDASSLGRASAAFKGLGKGMIGAGALAVGAFAYATKSAADFEKVISAVGAITGATGSDLDSLREKALDLATGSIFSAKQIATAFEDLGKAGITVPEILNGAADAVVHLAHAAGDELPGGIAQGAEIVANAMKTFDVGADQAEHFADVLVAAAASSTISVDDIATSFRYAGPIAHELGLSIDDLATTLAILGDRGIKGSTAGTSLRGVLLSLTPTSEKATNAMKKLGLITEDGKNKFYDLHGNLKPIPEVMQILGNATKNLSEQQKVQAFNTIFQRRAMNAALILADQGSKGFDKYAAAIKKLDASTIAAKKLDNLSGDMTVLKNTVNALIIRVGEPFQKMVRGWVQSLTGLVTWLSKLDPNLVSKIVLFAAVAGAVLIAGGAFLYMVGVAIQMYKNFKLLVEGIKLVAGAMKLLTASFLTNPIFLVIAAIVALIAILYLAYKRSDEFRARVDAAFQALKPAINAAVGFVKNFIKQFGNLIDVIRSGDDVVQGVAEVIDNMFGNTGKLIGPIKSIAAALQELWAMAQNAFTYFADHVLPTLIDFGIEVYNSIGKAVEWLISVGIPAFVDFAQKVQHNIGGMVDWFSKNVAPVFTDVFGAIIALVDRVGRVLGFFAPEVELAFKVVQAVLKFVWKIINTFVQDVLLIWGNFSDNILPIITGTWERVKQTIESVLRIIRGVITIFTGLISGDWGKAWDGIKAVVAGAWSLILDIVQNLWFYLSQSFKLGVDLLISVWEVLWNTVSDLVGGALQYIKDLALAFWGFFVEMFHRGWDLVVSTTKSAWNAIWAGIKDAFNFILVALGAFLHAFLDPIIGLWNAVTRALGDWGGKLYLFFQGAWTRAKDGISNAMDALIRFVKGIPQRIVDALGNLRDILYDAGKHILGGLIDGIKDALPDLGGALGKVGGFISDHKGPPSYDKVMLVENGQLIMQGLMRGILSQLPALDKLVSSIAPDITQQVALSGNAGNIIRGASTAPSASGPAPVSVTFEFPNVTSAAEAEGIEKAVGDGNALKKLVSTLKAGRRK